ncbi:MAG: hypothetical protein E7591_04960 [Ruminococcaceae bacterium]|nr:hypothetical protein [Oscillospiraceae bacterium]
MVFIACLIQPVLDVISFWTDRLGLPSAITLGMRLALLCFLVLYAFILTERKKLYVIAFVLLILFTVCHCAVTAINGADDLIGDITNLVRIYHFPVVTLCFITFLKSDEASYDSIKKAFVFALIIIAAVDILSVITNTNPYTYKDKEIGLAGWFYFANTQSAIISVLVCIFDTQVIKRFRNNIPMMVFLLFLSMGMLFLFATRLTYAAILLIGFGLITVLIITDRKNIKPMIALALVTLCFTALFPVSPMYNNQKRVRENAVKKQEKIELLIDEKEKKLKNEDLTEEEFKTERLRDAYKEYLGGIVKRFGLEKAVEEFSYSEKAEDICDDRRIKITYNELLAREQGSNVRLFGLELADLAIGKYNHDVENDFHGIYYLCGITGLVLLAGFILYFVFIIFKALIQDFKNKFDLESGAWGISLITLLMHVYATAGVLRRPNGSFYLSVTLAVIYYLATKNISKGPEDSVKRKTDV